MYIPIYGEYNKTVLNGFPRDCTVLVGRGYRSLNVCKINQAGALVCSLVYSYTLAPIGAYVCARVPASFIYATQYNISFCNYIYRSGVLIRNK